VRDPMTLPRAFYGRPTLDVARDLIGKVLVHRVDGTVTSGAIVEVEAYIGESDAACHAAPGLTKRNAPLYGPPGIAYVYLNYGIHALVNAVTEPEGQPAAVLIRALDPIDGIDTMRQRRAGTAKGRRGIDANRLAVHDLCRGPGNLTVAMAIGLADNRSDLCGDRLYIEDRGLAIGRIRRGRRIGIRVAVSRPWRFFVADHPAVSATPRRSGAARSVR
jgi:DNA-3-methyladenine glycosylase